MAETTNKPEWYVEVGKPAADSLREMVAALECDYDRLEELRDERVSLADEVDEAREALDNSDNIETQKAFNDAQDALKAWDDENGEELAELESSAACGDVSYPCKSQDDARERIQEDALSVRIFGEKVDGEWQADRFELLLTTGGPAVRIMGELNDNGEPHRAWLEVQDWGKPWTHYYESGLDEVCLAYANCFYFGD